jgi:hypothetical protein
MQNPTDDEIASMLVGILTRGFNRSLGALESAGAVNTKRMRGQYKGVGSKYHDLVTEQIEMTANYSVSNLRALFQGAARQDEAETPQDDS